MSTDPERKRAEKCVSKVRECWEKFKAQDRLDAPECHRALLQLCESLEEMCARLNVRPEGTKPWPDCGIGRSMASSYIFIRRNWNKLEPYRESLPVTFQALRMLCRRNVTDDVLRQVRQDSTRDDILRLMGRGPTRKVRRLPKLSGVPEQLRLTVNILEAWKAAEEEPDHATVQAIEHELKKSMSIVRKYLKRR